MKHFLLTAALFTAPSLVMFALDPTLLSSAGELFSTDFYARRRDAETAPLYRRFRDLSEEIDAAGRAGDFRRRDELFEERKAVARDIARRVRGH